MPTPITYPLDYTGNSVANRITQELHSVSEAHFRDYYFIVPNFAPFYPDNFQLSITVNNITTILNEDVDFSFALPYVTGTRVTGKALYGGITLHNLNLNGILSLNYQLLGGNQIADRLQVLTLLADKAYNPKTTIWDILSNTPEAFPPTPHYQDYSQFFGQEALVAKLGEIRDAIIANSSLTQTELQTFLHDIQIASAGNTSAVQKAGDTMLGYLTLVGTPLATNHAATKAYVDSAIDLHVPPAPDLTGYASITDLNSINTNLQTQINALQTQVTDLTNKLYEVLGYVNTR